MQYITDHQDPHHHHHTTTEKPMSPSKAGVQEQGSIKLSLVNSDLWKAFHTTGTEMVITKHGRRMFPHCNISLSGLEPFTNYVVMMDMIPVDRFKYKWNKEMWEVTGKAEPQPHAQTYVHPDSPALGIHWMKQSISFLKAKLTNNTLNQEGHIILHSMHRYSPRFHVVQADSAYTVHWSPHQTFSFPETHFTAVTAYQNTKITQLKIEHNPFAKGFREGGTHFHGKRSRPSKTSNNAEAKPMDREALCTSTSGLQGSLSAIESAKRRRPDGPFSPWSVDQDPAESLHTDALELPGQDHGGEEQMVPASMAYQPYRVAHYRRPSSPDSDADDRLRGSPHVPDVATVPGHHHHHPSHRDTTHHHHPSHRDTTHHHHPSHRDTTHHHHPSHRDTTHHHHPSHRDTTHHHHPSHRDTTHHHHPSHRDTTHHHHPSHRDTTHHHHPHMPAPGQDHFRHNPSPHAGGYPLYGPGPYPGGPGPYPGGHGPYPGGHGPYPGGHGPYPGGHGPYPGEHAETLFALHSFPAAAAPHHHHHSTAHPHHGYHHHGNTMAEWSQYPLFECGTSVTRKNGL